MQTIIDQHALAQVVGSRGPQPLGPQPDPDPAASCKYGLDEQLTVRNGSGRLLFHWTRCKPAPR